MKNNGTPAPDYPFYFQDTPNPDETERQRICFDLFREFYYGLFFPLVSPI